MNITVSACQLPLIPLDHFDDFEQQVRMLLEDVPTSSDYVLFPELCTLGLLTTFEDFHHLQPIDYQRVAQFLPQYQQLFTTLAIERQQVIIAGTTLEQQGDQFFNTAFIFDQHGEMYTHRKTHIFPGESMWDTAEGNTLEVFHVGPITFGVAICYEMEIPEIATRYQQLGADVIFCPSYTFTPHGFWRVRHCAQARAIENQVYVVHCPTTAPQLGIIQPGYGVASILTPCDLAWSENGVVAEATTHTATITAHLSMAQLLDNRQYGAATTVKDRQRRKVLYEAYNEGGIL